MYQMCCYFIKKIKEQGLPGVILKTNYLAFVQGNTGDVHCTKNDVLNIN